MSLLSKDILILLFIHLMVLTCENTEEKGGGMSTTNFEFISGNKLLSGIIDQPSNGNTQALIIFVHGSGLTDIRRENRYLDLRRRFTKMGIACATWDKPGTGRSEGRFDDNQSLEESSREVLDAIAYLRNKKIAGSDKIGIWSTSRGCWVTPIALSRDPDIEFWISVSGVPAEDNKYYLMKSNLPLEGRTPDETKLLMEEWKQGRQIFVQGGNYRSYLAATEHLRKDTSVLYFAGDLTGSREAYETGQKEYMSAKDQYEFDKETLSIIRVRGFDRILSELAIDVLALFGEKDTNVDWRKARTLYESTIGQNPDATLKIQTFPDGNHSITVSKTGSVREVEGTPLRAGIKSKGYYKVQVDWLREYVLSNNR